MSRREAAAPRWRRTHGRAKRLAAAPLAALLLVGAIVLAPSATAAPTDRSAPETMIDSGPSGTYRLGSAEFEFGASEPGATYECRLDGATFEPCGNTPTFHVSNGFHEIQVRAVDAAGIADPTPARREWWADALLQNGNFETPSAGWAEQTYAVPGWKAFGGSSTLSLTGDGDAGQTAARVVAAGDTTMSTYASPFPVNSAAAGDTYTLRGQVRSDVPGKRVCLRLRERSGSTLVATKQTCKTTSGSWTHFTPISLTVARDGSMLGVDAYQASPAAAGDSFELDGIELSDGNAPSVSEPPSDSGDPTLLAASDIASCWSAGDETVSRMLDTMAGRIVVPGDTEQNNGSVNEFAGCYDPSWGRHRDRTMPAVGDHEYRTLGARGYFDYFGAAAGEAGKGWYSYDLGAWHIIVLNSNCGKVGGCGPGSQQYEWLRADLERYGGNCIGAYWHHPLFSSGSLHGGLPRSRPFWNLLYRYKAEWVLSGNDHNYQRFAPQTPDGALDRERGMRQFLVGTGGTRVDPVGAPLPNTEAQSSSAFGVTQFTLRDGSYDWQFVPQPGKTFTDSGSTACSPLGNISPPETVIEDGPIGISRSNSASFAFSSNQPGAAFRCSLNGAPFVPCSSREGYTDLADGEHVFRVKAVGAGGTEDATPASRTWTVATNNLLPNGSFEGSLSGWYPYKSLVSLPAGGPDGSRFARVAPDGTDSLYLLTTSPRPVGSSVAGATYQAGGWMRSETPGSKVCLTIRERVNGSAVKSTASCRTASGTWERFNAATHVAVGGGSIEVFASRTGALAGESFDLDGLSLVVRP